MRGGTPRDALDFLAQRAGHRAQLDQQLQILAGLGLQQVDLEFGALGRLDRLGAAITTHQRHADPDTNQPVRCGLGPLTMC